MTNPAYLSIAELAQANTAQIDNALGGLSSAMRVACPGIIQAFDATEQTVTVRLALREKMIVNQRAKNVQIQDLIHVPVVTPRAGGYMLTLPIAAGDECLVVFGDQCIDSWWQSGGVQNPLKLRRHNLSDGFAIVGLWSQQRKVSNYSTSSAQLRSEDGSQVIDVSDGGITITGDMSSIDSSEVGITAEVGDVSITGDVSVSDNLHVESGATGTFSTSTGSTVTVQDGIVIDIG